MPFTSHTYREKSIYMKKEYICAFMYLVTSKYFNLHGNEII